MTISAVVPDIAFTGSGGAGTMGAFSLVKSGTPIVFYANSDIVVYRYDTVTDQIPLLLVEGTHYTLTGGPADGSITLISPSTGLLTAERLYVVRRQTLAQSLDLVNGGNFSSSNLERRLDVIETKLQEQARDIKSTVRFAMFDTDDIPGNVPLGAAIDKIAYVTGTASNPSIALADATLLADLSQFTVPALADIALVAADLGGADTIGIVAAIADEIEDVADNIPSILAVDANEANINAAASLLVQRRSLESFGALGDGVADDTTAFNLALASGFALAGTPGATYLIVGQVIAPAYFNLDLQGATLKLDYTGSAAQSVNNRYPINSTLRSFGSINTVSVQTDGDNVITLSAPPTNIAVGDTIGFFSDSLSGRWPINYRKVTAVSGSDITVDKMIPYTITGTITCRRIVFNPMFRLTNGTVDCTEVNDGAENVSGIIRMLSYEKAVIEDVTFVGIDLDITVTNYVMYSDYCYEVALRRVKAQDANRGGSFAANFRAARVTEENCSVSGEGFGIGDINCDWIQSVGNVISANYIANPGGNSTRGIRPIGVLGGIIAFNEIRDVDSAIKLEDCANILVIGNYARNTNTGVNLSDQNPSSRSGGHRIVDNRVDHYYANGIALGTSAVGDGLWRTCTVRGNIVGTPDASASEPFLVRGGSFVAGGNIVTQWPSGKNCFRTVDADGNASKGILESLYAEDATPSGRLGVSILATHTGVAIDYDRVICNAPGGKFAALPPVPPSRQAGTVTSGTFTRLGNANRITRASGNFTFDTDATNPWQVNDEGKVDSTTARTVTRGAGMVAMYLNGTNVPSATLAANGRMDFMWRSADRVQIWGDLS